MLKEFFQTLVAHAAEAVKPTILHPPGEPAHRYIVTDRAGKIHWQDAEPQPRDHSAFDLDTIIEWAKRQFADLDSGSGEVPVVWYSRQGVTLLLDNETRRDRVHLRITYHPIFGTVSSLDQSKTWYDQKTFLSLFRLQLGEYSTLNLEEAIRRIRFRKAESGETHIQVSKVSLGRQIEREISGGAEIPSRITLCIPVFHNRFGLGIDTTQDIECDLEVNPEDEKFLLVPLPGEVEQAIHAAETEIGAKLHQELDGNVPIYYGVP